MARLSFTTSILASALLFIAANAAPLEASMAPEESPIFQLPFVSPEPDFPVESPNVELPFASAQPDVPAASPLMEVPSPSPEPRNEGCVAIEHLQGYKLQHAQHLNRRVLCSGGFCATPNHAIIVDGAMTSMKQLCSSEWTCITTEKLVNNLSVFINRRAKVTDRITVTPYDMRFPRWCVWVAQAAEHAWNMASYSFIAIAVFAIVILRTNGLKSKTQ